MNSYKKILNRVPAHIVLIFFAIFALIPIWIIFISSVKPHVEVYKNQIALPKEFKFQFYNILFKQGYYKNFLNSFGYMTVAAVAGADNVTRQDEEEPTEFHSTTGYEEKCYRTSDGLVPFSVIIATVLCPPVGVFMEYGITGWLNILICIMLTFLFYFPGLIVFLYMTIGYVGESIQRGERGMDTTWMPYMWPIKTCLLIGIIFLLVQGISELLKSYWAAKKGEWPGETK